jgi:phytoene desaturase
MPSFIDRNFDSALDLVRTLRPAARLLRLGGARRLSTKVNGFFADERLRRLFSFQSMYAGLAPYEALALYGVITYMDSIGGVYFPEGGMHAVPTALAAAAEKAAAVIRYDTPVESIVLANGSTGAVRGVRLAGGDLIPADAVICSPDLPAAYRTLVPGLAPPRVARRGRYSPSAFVMHLGVRGALPSDTAHHNIHFGGQWEDAFRCLLHDGRRMPDPSFLVTVPTIGDPSMAPPGRHVLFALEPVPNLDGQLDWTTERERARDELQMRLDARGYPSEVEVEEIVDPSDWQRSGMERGTPFALAHRFFQSGPFRPGNVNTKAPGLVFTGSGTVPGVGVPMVLLSGRLAADRVDARP